MLYNPATTSLYDMSTYPFSGILKNHPMIRTLLAVLSACAAGVLSLIGGVMMAVLLSWCASERVYEVNTTHFTPSLDGRLVKLHVTELRVEGDGAREPVFGIYRPDALLIESVCYSPLSVNDGSYLAPRILSGVRELKFNDSKYILSSLGSEIIDPSTATLPEELKPLVEEITPRHIVLRAGKIDDDTEILSDLYFSYIPAGQKVDMYVTGRLLGNVVYVDKRLPEEDFVDYTRNHDLSGAYLYGFLLATILVCGAACCLTAIAVAWLRGTWQSRYVMMLMLYAQLLMGSIILAGYSLMKEHDAKVVVPLSAFVAIACMVLTVRAARKS